MNAIVVYDNIRDKELLDNINLEVPFFVEYVNMNTTSGKRQGTKIKYYWGAKLNPFIELYENNEIIQVFYSEKGNACNQLISYLNDPSKIQEIK